ncbi:MAG: hypothetical protein JKY37_00275 [Nannocystaceae bacterium]|nr:hypothetical protein [Nannocystaceae bacterium]
MSRAALEAENSPSRVAQGNLMNRLVPYLDLFPRLQDAELARLTGVPEETARALRKQVDAVSHALVRYVDLLPRLRDAELIRLTGASAKTIRFWRLCQPRSAASAAPRQPQQPGSKGTGEYAAATRSAPSGSVRPERAAVSEPASAPAARAVPEQAARPAPTQPSLARSASDTDLGVRGAPFPGYDQDASNAAALDDNSEGIFLGLDLPETGSHNPT